MNTIYKLIWNVSTGTWAVAHELAAARGKKTGRNRLAAALAAAMMLPAGAALAGDVPEAPTCAINETISADDLRCEATLQQASAGIGTLAALDDTYIKVIGNTAASASGGFSVAIGNNAQTGGWGFVSVPTGAVAIGNNAYAEPGARSSVFNDGSVAVGANAKSYGGRSVALGTGARASVDPATDTGGLQNGGVSIGFNSLSSNAGTAVGYQAAATADSSTALGARAIVNQDATSGVALGSRATVRGYRNADNSVSFSAQNSAAIGTGALVAASGTGAATSSLAMGTNSRVTAGTANSASANNSVAIGNDARVSADKAAADGSVALGSGTRVTASDAVALGSGSTADVAHTVSVGSASTQRRIVNMAAGTADTDAANLAQLRGVAAGLGGNAAVAADGSVTPPSYTVGGTTVNNVGAALTNLDGRVAINEGSITNLTQRIGDLAVGDIGIVTYDATAGAVNVAAAQGGSVVNLAGGAGVRTLAGVKDGTIAAGSAEAITGSQLNDTNERVTSAEGNITTIQTSVTNLGTRVTTAEGDITNLNTAVSNLSSGASGIVSYDADSGVVNVAALQAGQRVNIAGKDGNRVLAGVAEGKVDAASDEAVNGSQLNTTNERVALTETNVSNLDVRVTNNEGNITSLSSQVTNLSSGAIGLVTLNGATGEVQVASDKGGDRVDFEGADGKRRLGGVANGLDDGDAVTMAQLRAAGAIDPVSGDVLSVLTYDDSSLAKASLGGTNGTVLANVANGLIAAGSREAVNGGQLYQMDSDWNAKWSSVDGRLGALEDGISDGAIEGGSGDGGQSPGSSPGTGEGSVAIGDGSSGSGTGSVAIGEGAEAPNNDSVAIGSNSTTDRDNELSVGSPGSERVVSNVAAATRPTDAVNLQQMNDRFDTEREYTDGRFNQMDKRLDRMGAISAAYAGMATNTAGLSGDSRIGAGIGSQNGRSALAVGYQRILGDRKNISVSLGGAFSGSDKSVSAGAGFSW